jgi:hypothetical protein
LFQGLQPSRICCRQGLKIVLQLQSPRNNLKLQDPFSAAFMQEYHERSIQSPTRITGYMHAQGVLPYEYEVVDGGCQAQQKGSDTVSQAVGDDGCRAFVSQIQDPPLLVDADCMLRLTKGSTERRGRE